MTQSEIFQNMTKGEWKPFQDEDTYGILKVDKGFGRIIICEGMRQGKTEGKADAELICMMKRETIDKGINPESVEKLVGMLNEVANNYAFIKSFPAWSNELKEALNASCL